MLGWCDVRLLVGNVVGGHVERDCGDDGAGSASTSELDELVHEDDERCRLASCSSVDVREVRAGGGNVGAAAEVLLLEEG